MSAPFGQKADCFADLLSYIQQHQDVGNNYDDGAGDNSLVYLLSAYYVPGTLHSLSELLLKTIETDRCY